MAKKEKWTAHPNDGSTFVNVGSEEGAREILQKKGGIAKEVKSGRTIKVEPPQN